MDEKAKIKDRLQKKEQEIHGLEEKIRAARVYIQALRDVLKLLDDEPSDSAVQTVLKAGSAVAKAREVIRGEGRPVHINELLEALGKEVTREGRASLTSSLAAYVRRGEIFTRPAPNTFGLIELGHNALLEEVAAEPPPGFGRGRPVSADLDEEIPF